MEVNTERFRGRTLPDSVAEKLENLCALGQLDLQELDERAFDALKELNEDGALGVLDQFANSDLSHVQNKSAFLCGIMKTHREKKRQELNQDVNQQMSMPNTNAESQVEAAAGPNEEKIRELLDRTGYSLDITMGQRRYGGPPPAWEGTPPPTGPSGCCQVFVGKIPRDMFEDELIPPFEKYGQIYDFRLMMDPHTGQNKGYGFCTFADRDSAQSACKGLDNTEIRRSRRLGVCISIANDRLFVGSIPKTKSKQDILEEFRQHTDNLKDVIVYISAEDRYKNRGFAFLEYDTHKAAALARRRLMSGRVKVWGHIVPSVDWADPLEEPDTETMAKVRVVHVRNVSPNTTEESLQQTFSQFGEVERVKKLKSYAFIHYKERDFAMKAIEDMHGKTLDGLVIEVSLAKPQQQSREKRHGQSGFGALNAPGQQPHEGGFQGRGRGGMRGRGGPRGRGFGGPRGGYGGGYNDGYGGGYGGGYNEGYGGGYNEGYGGGYNEGYGGGYGGGYGDGYEGGNGYGGGYDDYGGGNGYGGGYEGYDNSYGGGYGGGDSGYGGGYGGGRGGGPRGRGGPGTPRGGPRGRGGPGSRGGPPGRGGPRGSPGRGGPGGRGGPRGGPRGGRGAPGAGGPQGKRKFEGEGGGAGGGTVSYPEPKRRFNQAGSQPIAQQPLEQKNQSYGGGYDQSNQWYQDTSYQQWS